MKFHLLHYVISSFSHKKFYCCNFMKNFGCFCLAGWILRLEVFRCLESSRILLVSAWTWRKFGLEFVKGVIFFVFFPILLWKFFIFQRNSIINWQSSGKSEDKLILWGRNCYEHLLETLEQLLYPFLPWYSERFQYSRSNSTI